MAKILINELEIKSTLLKVLNRLKELQDATGYPTAATQIEVEELIKKLSTAPASKDSSPKGKV